MKGYYISIPCKISSNIIVIQHNYENIQIIITKNSTSDNFGNCIHE